MKTKRGIWLTAFLIVSIFVATGATTRVNAAASEISYKGVQGMGQTWNENRSIPFSAYTKNTYQTSSKIPSLSNTNVNYQSNDCAPIAGANILAFYDIVKPDLIPGFKVGRVIGGKYIFNTPVTNQYFQKAIDVLYIGMKTNQFTDGTTERDFLAGLNQYVKQKGLIFQTSGGLLNNGSVNISALKQHLQSKNLAVLFMQKYNITPGIKESNGQLTFTAVCSQNPHIVVVYGIEEYSITYNGNTTTEYFLKIANTFEEFSYGLIRINDYLDLIDFLKVTIL